MVISWLVREWRNILLRISEDKFWIEAGDPGLVLYCGTARYISTIANPFNA